MVAWVVIVGLQYQALVLAGSGSERTGLAGCGPSLLPGEHLVVAVLSRAYRVGVGLTGGLPLPLRRFTACRPSAPAGQPPGRASTALGDRLTPSRCSPSRSRTACPVSCRAVASSSGHRCSAGRGLGRTSSTSTGPNAASKR